MRREVLEQRQVWCYLAAVVLGALLGRVFSPELLSLAEMLIWPGLAVLLYSTFMQVPMERIVCATRDIRFLSAACLGNFLILPLLAWALIRLLPAEEPVRLGMLMVLLVPCTDWFITFAYQGRADAARATALTPLNLLVQFALLPLYLLLFTGGEAAAVLEWSQLAEAVLIVTVPLALALLTDRVLRRAARHRTGTSRASGLGQEPALREHLAWYPVPALTAVILLVAAAHTGEVVGSLEWLPQVAGVVGLFLLGSLGLALLLAKSLQLPGGAGRTLAFTFGTRNSFVVLPLALVLPAGWEAAAVVIVVQSLLELLAMILWVRLVPTLIRG